MVIGALPVETGGNRMNNMVMTGGDAFDSVEAFVSACSVAAGSAWGNHAAELIGWWTSEQSGQVRATADRVMLDRIGAQRTDLALLTLTRDGEAWGPKHAYGVDDVCAEMTVKTKRSVLLAADAAEVRSGAPISLLHAS